MDDLAARVSRGLGLYGALARALQSVEQDWRMEVDGVVRPVHMTPHETGVLFEAWVPDLPDVAVVRLMHHDEAMCSMPIERPRDYTGALAWNLSLEGEPARS